jgi:NACHT domain/TIR domain
MDQQFKYDVCLSFASEDREYVSKVSDKLNKEGLKYFYDEENTVYLWGKNLYEELNQIYREESRFCVMFISKHYIEKMWTKLERRSAQARALQDASEYILPVRVDDTELDRLFPTVSYIDRCKYTPEKLAKLIIEKVRGNSAESPRAPISYDNAYKMDEKDSQCLKDLRTTDPGDDKVRIEKNKGGLLEDSYRWILENTDFRQWRDDQQSRLLWIKGDPGKGKTMLLCGIINELKKSTVKTGCLSFFFCDGTDVRINNATAVLRGLIYMLIDQQPSLIRYIRETYDHAGKALFEDVNAWVALSRIFANILQDPSLKNACLIIDALDECQTADLPKLLDFIVQMSSAFPHVKWIVSSRNWRNIEERLETAQQKVRLSLELNAESISTAVSTYIRHKVLWLTGLKGYDNQTRDAVQDHLSSNANDTFLWVALVCKNLEKIERWNTRTRLNEFPAGLDPLYRRMMEQVYNSDDANLCKQMLAIVITVYRPITLNELMSFVEIPGIASNDLESLAEIIGLCGSFLTLRESTVHFVHQSAKDFLLEKVSEEIFVSGVGDVHYTIFSRSLEVMSRALQRDMYGLYAPGFPISKVEQPDPDPLAAANYSCIYWVDHLQDWDFSKSMKHRDDIQDGGAVDKFLRQKYLYWLEALSLLRSVSEGVLSMDKLEDLLQVSLKSILLSRKRPNITLGKGRGITID